VRGAAQGAGQAERLIDVATTPQRRVDAGLPHSSDDAMIPLVAGSTP
jgi:hypothetical protein